MIFFHLYQCDENIKTISRKKLLENLSHYLNKEQKDISIKKNKNGKPMVDGIYFSVSHSRCNVVQVFSKIAEIGVDLEYKNNKRLFLKLAQRYFHESEYKKLTQLQNPEALDLFYNLWTAKEAVCKAEGGRLWYYLADNYLTKNLNLTPIINGMNLHHLNTLSDFSLCIAYANSIENITYV